MICHSCSHTSDFKGTELILSRNLFSAEEVDLSFNSETKEHPLISNPSL